MTKSPKYVQESLRFPSRMQSRMNGTFFTSRDLSASRQRKIGALRRGRRHLIPVLTAERVNVIISLIAIGVSSGAILVGPMNHQLCR